MRFRGVLKEHAPLWDALLRISDIAVTVLTGWLAALLYLGSLPELPGYSLALVLGALLCQVFFPRFGAYQAWRGIRLIAELRAVLLAWLATMSALTFLVFVTKTGPEFSRGWFLIWLCLGGVALILSRVLLRSALQALRRRGFNTRRIVVAGLPGLVHDVTNRIEQQSWLGLIVDASFPLPLDQVDALSEDIEQDPFAHLAAHAAARHVDQVWVVAPLSAEQGIRQVQWALRQCTCDVRYVPDISSFYLLNHSISEVAGLPVINLTSSGLDAIDRGVKTIEDYVLATLIVILAAPLMLAIALGVKISSPGPVLFRQQRSGLGGESIEVLKFRTMHVHAETEGVVTQAKRNDPRVTRFGAFLRRSSLDELPQFFNVLKGEMSIVGPRPHAIEHSEHYMSLLDSYMARHKVKPGITGWAQINGCRGETDTLEKMRTRVELDLEYLERWSLWMDLKIIGTTIRQIFRDPFAY